MTEKKSAGKKAATFDYDDDAYYDIDLHRSTEFPPGSGKWIPAGAKIEMRGRAAKLLKAEDVADAKPKS